MSRRKNNFWTSPGLLKKPIFTLDSTSTPTHLNSTSSQLKLDFNSISVSTEPYLNLNLTQTSISISNSTWTQKRLWHKSNPILSQLHIWMLFIPNNKIFNFWRFYMWMASSFEKMNFYGFNSETYLWWLIED